MGRNRFGRHGRFFKRVFYGFKGVHDDYHGYPKKHIDSQKKKIQDIIDGTMSPDQICKGVYTARILYYAIKHNVIYKGKYMFDNPDYYFVDKWLDDDCNQMETRTFFRDVIMEQCNKVHEENWRNIQYFPDWIWEAHPHLIDHYYVLHGLDFLLLNIPCTKMYLSPQMKDKVLADSPIHFINFWGRTVDEDFYGIIDFPNLDYRHFDFLVERVPEKYKTDKFYMQQAQYAPELFFMRYLKYKTDKFPMVIKFLKYLDWLKIDSIKIFIELFDLHQFAPHVFTSDYMCWILECCGMNEQDFRAFGDAPCYVRYISHFDIRNAQRQALRTSLCDELSLLPPSNGFPGGIQFQEAQESFYSHLHHL